MLMLVSIESTMTSPTVALARENERSFQAALSAALVCCPTSPEDATYITRRGMSRATTLLLDGRRPRAARDRQLVTFDFAFAAGNLVHLLKVA